MAILPAEVPTGLVTGQFYFVSEDNIDADTDPELLPVTGDITFTSSAKVLRMPGAKVTVIPRVFKAKFDAMGNIRPANASEPGLKLPATDTTEISPRNYTWKVEFDLKETGNNYTVQVPSFDIQVPAGTTVDLTTVMPVDQTPGTITIAGPPGTPGAEGPAGPQGVSNIALDEDGVPYYSPGVGDSADVVDGHVVELLSNPDSATSTALTATYASGFVHFVVSDTEPTETEIDGKPVVWINTNATPLTEVTATAPTFSDLSGTGSDTYTIPITTGVDYKVGGVTKDAGTYVGSGSVTITAVAQAGYTLIGTTSWSNTFSSATTDLYPSHAIYDTFTAADATAVNGRTTEKGGLVWSASAAQTLGGSEVAPTITGNAINNTSGTIQTLASSITLSQLNAEISAEYDISAGTAAAADRRAYLVIGAGADNTDTLSVQIRGDGSLLCYKGGVVAITLTGTTTGHAASGTLTVSYNAGALTITTPTGTATATITTGTGFTGNGRKALFGARGNGAKIDNFRVKYL